MRTGQELLYEFFYTFAKKSSCECPIKNSLMDKFLIQGGNPLRGTIEAGGSKNSALPLLFATLLSDGPHHLTHVPRLRDMESTRALLEHLGVRIETRDRLNGGSDWTLTAANLSNSEAPYDLVRKMRASIYCLGPLLARLGRARVSLPGGCAIGARPVDLHLMALEKMGAVLTQKAGYVEASLPRGQSRLKGANIIFPLVSVGATANTLMAASLADGVTVLENAAREPEISELCDALISMGAEISGQGSSQITIRGKATLKPLNLEIPRDRIETATYLIGAHLSSGDVTVEGARASDFQIVLDMLEESGAKVVVTPQSVRVISSGRIKPVDIKTAPFPGFPTDVQAQWTSLMCHAEGDSAITETIFENRFMHVPELVRMNADLEIVGSTVRVRGRPGCLEGAPVMATDLRASACLVLAGAVAKGETSVKRIYHLDRGYESMEKKLVSLGCRVERCADV